MLCTTHDQAELRERLDHFWVEAQGQLPVSAPGCLTRLQYEVLRTNRFRPEHEQVPPVVGSTTAHQVQDLFQPQSHAPRPRLNSNGSRTVRRGSGAGRSRMFPDSTWNELAVVPFHDRPDTISGFWLSKDQPSLGAQDVIFKSTLGRTGSGIKEAGLALRDNASKGSHPALAHLFVIADVNLAVKMHLRWLWENRTPLPIVGTFEDAHHAPRGVWQCLRGPKRILWAPHIGPREVLQARFADARLSQLEASADEILGSGWSSFHWLWDMKEDTISWQDALRRELHRLPPDQAEQILHRAEFKHYELREFLRGCNGALLAKLRSVLEKPEFRPRTVVNGHRIVAREGAWYNDRTGDEICNAPIKITQVIFARRWQTYLRGQLQLNGEAIPFIVDRRQAESQGMLSALRGHLPASVIAALRFRPRWSRDLSTIAMQFHEPEAICDADVVGWTRCRFQFPQFALGLGGAVHPEGAFLAGPAAPCVNFAPPRALYAHELRPLSARTRETRLFWATVAAIVHSVLAPLFHRQPSGIGLLGTGAQVIGRESARLLGCPEFPMLYRQGIAPALARLDRACGQHHWPLLLAPPTQTSVALRTWIDAPSPRNCVVPLNDALAELALRRGWIIVRSKRHFDMLDKLERIGPRIMPAYLLSVMQRRGSIWFETGNLLENIMHDLAEWLAEQGGDAEAVLRAEHVLAAESFPNHRRASRPRSDYRSKVAC
jgi:hypothetical protein